MTTTRSLLSRTASLLSLVSFVALCLALAAFVVLSAQDSARVQGVHVDAAPTASAVPMPTPVAPTPVATDSPAHDATTSRAPEPPRPCGYEDASDLADGETCRWDAESMGNGMGQSFAATRYGDVIMYVYNDFGDAVWTNVFGASAEDQEALEVGDGWAPPEPAQNASEATWDQYCQLFDQGVTSEDGFRFCDG